MLAQRGIHTENKAQPVLNIPVSANVVGEIRVEPCRLLLGQIDKNLGDKKSVRLVSIKQPFKILSIKSDLGFVLVESPVNTPGIEHMLSITVSDNAPAGRFSGNVIITTDNVYQREITIPVFGFVSEIRLAE